ncbi:hypothetical protein K432DRAFT_467660 [Lepidopterella palustris CBS 459.81]|uniref:Uncharacterized protein n=1 Tax=Lepidopterella palustris CBS 459.81 TaxID=1314670 RepID=A0A8E2E0J4_9PEZI|nr:hypothetical protein K432DRAFT_467660 [Lepidopterella palustris CBS 459.81]
MAESITKRLNSFSFQEKFFLPSKFNSDASDDNDNEKEVNVVNDKNGPFEEVGALGDEFSPNLAEISSDSVKENSGIDSAADETALESSKKRLSPEEEILKPWSRTTEVPSSSKIEVAALNIDSENNSDSNAKIDPPNISDSPTATKQSSDSNSESTLSRPQKIPSFVSDDDSEELRYELAPWPQHLRAAEQASPRSREI